MTKRKKSSADHGVDGNSEADEGYFAYDGLTRVLHEKARLGMVTALRARADGLSFAELKALCSLTDGNLSRHLTVLCDAGFVTTKKDNRGSRPKTSARLTSKGRKEFDGYIEELQRVIQDAGLRFQPEGGKRRPKGDTPPGLAPA